MREQLRLISKLVKTCTPYRYHWYSLRGYSFSTLKPPWNILFFGTDDFSLESLKMLHSEMKSGQHLVKDLKVVCAQFKCPVAKYSIKHNLTLLQWRPSIEEVVKTEAHIGLVASFGHLIPSSMISAFPLGMLNVHASLLPRWRGAAPIVHAVLSKDKTTGVTIMKIRPHKFDEGEILGSASCDVGPHETALHLTRRMAVLGAAELHKCIQDLPQCLAQAKPQPLSGVTLAPKIIPSMSACDWSTQTSDDIYAQHLALHHLHPLYASWQDQPIRILECSVAQGAQGAPGDVRFDYQSKRLLVSCSDSSTLAVTSVQIPGKPKISALDFSNGYLKKVAKHLWRFNSGDKT